MTHYDILGVTPDAPHRDIKHNYRTLVKQYHPDLNSSIEAKALIVRITEAYDILSDPNKKLLYDWQLLGQISAPKPAPPTEREVYKREYIKKRRAQEQHNWEQLFAIKVKFYKYQRYFAYLFLAIGLIYTFDFYVTKPVGDFELLKISRNKYDAGGSLGFLAFTTDLSFFYEVKKHDIRQVELHYSQIFNVPVGVKIGQFGYFRFNETIHTLNNIPAILLLLFAGLLLWQKNYSDWSLTLGLIPFFVLTFLVLLTYITLSGVTL